jgi:hypothetical protein
LDFKLVVDTFPRGTPWAILATLVGIVLQFIYVRSQDHFHDAQARRELALEENKFKHQKEIENQRFEYDQRRWKEELGKEIALKHIDIRLDEYAVIWSRIESIGASVRESGELTRESTRALAGKIKEWRYSKAGLLAEETTRDAATALQVACWHFDGTCEAYRQMRRARTLFRNAIRADLGLDASIYELTAVRNRIREELQNLQQQLPKSDSQLSE